MIPQINILASETAKNLLPGDYFRPYGRLRVHGRGKCRGAAKMAVVRVATGDTYLVSGCEVSVLPNSDWILVRRDRVVGGTLGCAECNGACGLGECPPTGTIGPGAHLEVQSTPASIPTIAVRPTYASIPQNGARFQTAVPFRSSMPKASLTVTGMGECSLFPPYKQGPPSSYNPGIPVKQPVYFTTALRPTSPGGGVVPFPQRPSSAVGIDLRVTAGGLGKGNRWQTFTPSSAKLKRMIRLETGEDLTPQQIELTRQLMHQGVPRSEIRNILAKEELKYLKEEQQELIPFQTEGSSIGQMRRAPIDEWMHGSDIVARSYASSMTPRQREKAMSHDEIRDYVQQAMNEEGLTAKEIAEFFDTSSNLGIHVDFSDDSWDYEDAIPQGMEGLSELGKSKLKKIGKKIKKVVKKVGKAIPKVIAVAAPLAALIPGVGTVAAIALATAGAGSAALLAKKAAAKQVKKAKGQEREYTQQAETYEKEAVRVKQEALVSKELAKVQENMANAYGQAVSDYASAAGDALSSQTDIGASELAPGVETAVQKGAQAEVDRLVAAGMSEDRARELVARATASAVQGQASAGPKAGVPWYVWVGGAAVALFATKAA